MLDRAFSCPSVSDPPALVRQLLDRRLCGCRIGWLGLPILLGLLSPACAAVTTVDLLPSPSAAGNPGSTTLGPAGAGGRVGGTSGAAGGTATGLLHRYDFSGVGTIVSDTIGGRDATVKGGAALDGSGQLSLAGDSLQYVELPPGLIASLTSVTLVAFVTWRGNNAWQSVFNFGATDTGAPSENVRAQFFFTPLMQPGPGPSLHLNVAYGVRPQDSIDGTAAFPIDRPAVVVAMLDGDRGRLSLYIDGAIVLQPKSTDQRLADLDDSNAWLGQSQWAHDVERSKNFRGSFDEFRIYGGTLSEREIQNLSDPNLL